MKWYWILDYIDMYIYLTKIDSDGVITDKDTGKGKY